MRKLTLNYYQDPGHGWVKCSIGLLYGLGIADKISFYSYTRGENVYLEEDLDLNTLYKACDVQGIELKLKQYHTNKSSKIRSYEHYSRGTK
jgi:hypothetical protein